MDTLRKDHLGVYGSNQGHTPALDAFAQSAAVFTNAATPAPFTMPAMAGLMTGRYPDRVGVSSHSRRDRLRRDVATIARSARSAGYRTGAVVTNPWLATPTTGFAGDFDDFLTGRNRPTSGSRGARMPASEVTDAALELLAAQPRDARSFLWVHYMDAHMPYQPPREFAAAAGVPEATSAIVRDFVEVPASRQRIYFEAPYAAATIEDTRRLYAAAVRYADSEIGRLLTGVRELGRADDTVVVIAADHGESLGEHGIYFAHDFTLYQELLSIPLIVHIPGEAGARVDTPVSLIDVFATLCELAPLECPNDLDGRPLPVNAKRSSTGRALFAAGPPFRARYAAAPTLSVPGPSGRWTAVRIGDRKLIRVPKPAGASWELYDLARDPRETRNIYNPEDAADLQRALYEWNEAIERDRPKEPPAPKALGRSTREALEELGYLD